MKASNIYERQARTAKASRIALALQRAHTETDMPFSAAEAAQRLTPEQRRDVEAAVGVRPASSETWREVVRLLTPTMPMSDEEFQSVLREVG